MRHINFAIFLCLTLLSATAVNAADLNCSVTMKDWQPLGVAKAAVKARGWKVQRINIDDGCYDVTGWDKQGNELEARINPATLEVVKMKIKKFKQIEDTDTTNNNTALKPKIKRKD